MCCNSSSYLVLCGTIRTKAISSVVVDAYWFSTIRTYSEIGVIVITIWRQFVVNNFDVSQSDLIKIRRI